MYTVGEKIVPRDIEHEIKDSYLSYAMSVIVGRALPDVRDGLKPAHRRILYAMQELSLEHTKPYKKSARIVGEVLGKYHPHGDTAVYDTLVRMVQDFSLRYPLIDGQGNFGSVDGDTAAAMRYTEARLAHIADALLGDLDKETVDFVPNFDETLTEPTVLPAALPNLLVNGSNGIAVGMATNIPPHNLNEAIAGINLLIEQPDATTKDLMKVIKGPDFPTGAIICGREGIRQAYDTGRGSVKVRAKVHIEAQKSGRETIIVEEIPYQVNKANLIEAMAGLVQDKKIEGISDLRDESDKDGMRIVIELKRDANSQVILNQLYAHTQMETSFGVIMLALLHGRPKVLTLREMLQAFIDHRKEIVIRRTRFLLRKAEERAHILEGLKIAIANLDAIIKLIKQSKSPAEAKVALMAKFKLSDRQAQAILELQLQRLTALEREKIEEEYLALLKQIEQYKAILASEKKVLALIQDELGRLQQQFGDERRTQIVAEAEEINLEDLIAEEDVVVTISHEGYIKRLPVSAYRKQRRGGVGITAMDMREEDFVEQLFIASTHDHLLFLTDKGKGYLVKVHEIPQASRQAKGKAIINLLALGQGERMQTFTAIQAFDPEHYLLMATAQGVVKKTRLAAYANLRKSGIIAITLDEGDALIEALVTDGNQELLLLTKQGKAIRFAEQQVRETGRSARGVKGITLGPKDRVIDLTIVRPDATVLTVTALGFGKRSPMDAYRVQSRGGKGIINIAVTAKNGEAIGAKTVTDQDELMLITQEGMMVRLPVKDIRVTGRNAQGVRLVRLKGKDRVTSAARLAPDDEDDAAAPAATGKSAAKP